MSPRNELAKWMTPDTSDVRVNRLWARVQESRDARPRWLAPALGAAMLAAAGMIVAFAVSARPLDVGSELAGGHGTTVGHFSDGSKVELASAGAVRLVAESSSEVRVELERGAATFEVSKRPTRKFLVEAGDVEVKVVGTRFTVTHSDGAIDVSVEHGIVEVTQDARTVRLTAGQKWSSLEAHAEAEDETDVPDAVAATAPSPASDAVAPARPVRPAKTHHVAHHSGTRTVAAPSEAAPAVPTVPVLPANGGAVEHQPTPAPPAGPTAAELFNDALTARREGRASDAALSFERILRDFPHDSHSATAAFELGRVRMDQLNDMRGAALALEQALKLSPEGTYLEEALSRLVRAYDALGPKSSCVHYRDQYLARFPNGPYASSVSARCSQ